MKALAAPLFFPEVAGPWGVDTIGDWWCVIHKDTLVAKRVGRIGARGTNFHDKAMKEAADRNHSLRITGRLA